MDLHDGYHNIRLREFDRRLTSVRTLLGKFQYTVMAQGLKNACAYFQRVVDEVYEGLRLVDGIKISSVCATSNKHIHLRPD